MSERRRNYISCPFVAANQHNAVFCCLEIVPRELFPSKPSRIEVRRRAQNTQAGVEFRPRFTGVRAIL
jgi:hypothetical protein